MSFFPLLLSSLQDISNANKFYPTNSKACHVLPAKNTNLAVCLVPSEKNLLVASTKNDSNKNSNFISGKAVIGMSDKVTLTGIPKNVDRNPKNADSYQYTGRVDDIDERDRDDPFSVAEYAEEMHKNAREQEEKSYVSPMYMKLQPEITNKMRSILVDWLVSVHCQYRLSPETLYLTINIIDRYLNKVAVPRTKLQLVGATALLIASKYEEIYAPQVQDMVAICDNIYQRQEIVQMETSILGELGYMISVPTAHTFLVRYLKAGHADEKIAQIACYILEGTLLSYSLLQFRPSKLAAAAVLIARCSTHRNPWSPTLLHYSYYFEEEITPIARMILEERTGTSSDITAVNNKYGARRFGRVSKLEMWCE